MCISTLIYFITIVFKKRAKIYFKRFHLSSYHGQANAWHISLQRETVGNSDDLPPLRLKFSFSNIYILYIPTGVFTAVIFITYKCYWLGVSISTGRLLALFPEYRKDGSAWVVMYYCSNLFAYFLKDGTGCCCDFGFGFVFFVLLFVF